MDLLNTLDNKDDRFRDIDTIPKMKLYARNKFKRKEYSDIEGNLVHISQKNNKDRNIVNTSF